MATVKNLNVQFGANTAVFDKKVKKSSLLTKSFKKNLIGLGKIAATAFVGKKIIGIGKESLDLFIRQEDAVNKLAASLKLAGDDSASSVSDMEDFARSVQKVTTFGDEAVLEIAALGASMGKLTGEQLKEATKAAIGMSQAFEMDAVSAMRLVAKAAQGDTSALGRYGIKLDESLTQQEKFNEVLRIGADAFGLAEEAAKTTGGRMQQFSNMVGDLKERVGAGLVRAFEFLRAEFAPFKDDFKAMLPDIKRYGVELADLARATIPVLIDSFKLFLSVAIEGLSALASVMGVIAEASEAIKAALAVPETGEEITIPDEVLAAERHAQGLVDEFNRLEASFNAAVAVGDIDAAADALVDLRFAVLDLQAVDITAFSSFAGDLTHDVLESQSALVDLESAYESAAESAKHLAYQTARIGTGPTPEVEIKIDPSSLDRIAELSDAILKPIERLGRGGDFGVLASRLINIRGLAGTENIEKDSLNELVRIRQAVEAQKPVPQLA